MWCRTVRCFCAVKQVASESSQISGAQPSGNSDIMLTLSVYNPLRVLSVSDMCNLPGPQLFAIWTVSCHLLSFSDSALSHTRQDLQLPGLIVACLLCMH